MGFLFAFALHNHAPPENARDIGKGEVQDKADEEGDAGIGDAPVPDEQAEDRRRQQEKAVAEGDFEFLPAVVLYDSAQGIGRDHEGQVDHEQEHDNAEGIRLGKGNARQGDDAAGQQYGQEQGKLIPQDKIQMPQPAVKRAFVH